MPARILQGGERRRFLQKSLVAYLIYFRCYQTLAPPAIASAKPITPDPFQIIRIAEKYEVYMNGL
jgi:hypothetical protein